MDHAAESTQDPGTGDSGTACSASGAGARWTPLQFAAAFDVHWRLFWSIAAGVMNDRVGAEDAVQEAALLAMGKLNEFDPASNFVAWMGSFVRYTALNHARRGARESGSILVENAMIAGRDVPARDEGTSPRLATALDVLDPIARACLVLRTTNDLSYREIAAALDIPEGTAMSHVHRSRATLRQLLDARAGAATAGRGATAEQRATGGARG